MSKEITYVTKNVQARREEMQAEKLNPHELRQVQLTKERQLKYATKKVQKAESSIVKMTKEIASVTKKDHARREEMQAEKLNPHELRQVQLRKERQLKNATKKAQKAESSIVKMTKEISRVELRQLKLRKERQLKKAKKAERERRAQELLLESQVREKTEMICSNPLAAIMPDNSRSNELRQLQLKEERQLKKDQQAESSIVKMTKEIARVTKKVHARREEMQAEKLSRNELRQLQLRKERQLKKTMKKAQKAESERRAQELAELKVQEQTEMTRNNPLATVMPDDISMPDNSMTNTIKLPIILTCQDGQILQIIPKIIIFV